MPSKVLGPAEYCAFWALYLVERLFYEFRLPDQRKLRSQLRYNDGTGEKACLEPGRTNFDYLEQYGLGTDRNPLNLPDCPIPDPEGYAIDQL